MRKVHEEAVQKAAELPSIVPTDTCKSGAHVKLGLDGMEIILSAGGPLAPLFQPARLTIEETLSLVVQMQRLCAKAMQLQAQSAHE